MSILGDFACWDVWSHTQGQNSSARFWSPCLKTSFDKLPNTCNDSEKEPLCCVSLSLWFCYNHCHCIYTSCWTIYQQFDFGRPVILSDNCESARRTFLKYNFLFHVCVWKLSGPTCFLYHWSFSPFGNVLVHRVCEKVPNFFQVVMKTSNYVFRITEFAIWIKKKWNWWKKSWKFATEPDTLGLEIPTYKQKEV